MNISLPNHIEGLTTYTYVLDENDSNLLKSIYTWYKKGCSFDKMEECFNEGKAIVDAYYEQLPSKGEYYSPWQFKEFLAKLNTLFRPTKKNTYGNSELKSADEMMDDFKKFDETLRNLKNGKFNLSISEIRTIYSSELDNLKRAAKDKPYSHPIISSIRVFVIDKNNKRFKTELKDFSNDYISLSEAREILDKGTFKNLEQGAEVNPSGSSGSNIIDTTKTLKGAEQSAKVNPSASSGWNIIDKFGMKRIAIWVIIALIVTTITYRVGTQRGKEKKKTIRQYA